LIQELVSEGMHSIKKYEPKMDKIMRMHSVTSTIENGFVHIPDKAAWLQEYLHELATFPKGKYDDQADSTSQALDWFKEGRLGLFDYYQQENEKIVAEERCSLHSPSITRGEFLRELDQDGWPFRRE